MLYARRGFTLIELLIVILIIGILAAVAVPMMRGYVDKAKKTEAVAALGTIRTAQRLYYAEFNAYAPAIANLSVYLATTDLDGRYFLNSCYNIPDSSAANLTLSAIGSGDSAGLNVWMNVNGKLTGF